MSDHPANGRLLSPEEKAKYREWQTNEILRRRGGAAVPGPDGADEPDEPTALPACPKCQTPYRNPKFKRCFVCERAASGKPEPTPSPKPAPAPRPAPIAPEDTVSRVIVPVPVPPACGATPAATASALPVQSTVTALRAVVAILESLDDDSARWVADAAYRLSRSEP